MYYNFLRNLSQKIRSVNPTRSTGVEGVYILDVLFTVAL
jgi:hypothetical protein